MGHTQGFYQNRNFTPQEWDLVCKVSTLIFDQADQLGIQLGDVSGTPGTEPEVHFSDAEDSFIHFNGIGPKSCESFLITINQEWDEYMDKNAPPFNFCKTKELPYDLIVMAILGACSVIAPGIYTLKSDSNADEWKPALELAAKVLGVDPNVFRLNHAVSY